MCSVYLSDTSLNIKIWLDASGTGGCVDGPHGLQVHTSNFRVRTRLASSPYANVNKMQEYNPFHVKYSGDMGDVLGAPQTITVEN